MRFLPFLLGALLFATPAAGQVSGECSSKRDAFSVLDVNNVRAPVSVSRPLFLDGGFTLPSLTQDDIMSCLMPQLVGQRDGEMRRSSSFFAAGPTTAGDTDECGPFNRVWKIDRHDLEAFDHTGIPSADMRDWPYQEGAPVTDGDGISDNYNLAGGDRPTLFGDQTVWWVMHDRPYERESAPIGVDVQVTAFAFRGVGAIANATFYRYRFVNAGTSPIKSLRFGLSPEIEFQRRQAWAGSKSDLDLTYHYSADADGLEGPALGIAYVPASLWPESEKLLAREGPSGLHAFVVDTNPQGRISGSDPVAMANLMDGIWRDGKPIVAHGDGRDVRGRESRLMFDGDPVQGSGWTMASPGPGESPIDRWFRDTVGSTSPLDLSPGQAADVVFAVTYAHGETPLDGLATLFDQVDIVRRNAEYLLSPDVRAPEVVVQPPTYDLSASKPYPNPFAASATIEYTVEKQSPVELRVYDMLGREVQRSDLGVREPGPHAASIDGLRLAPGSYLYRIRVGSVSASGVLVRSEAMPSLVSPRL